jgi:glyoxylase-like metal-dependent hydrolase (beta-lactamase superfamily II)
MEFQVIPVTDFQQNCSLLICPETRRAAWVDPGGEIERLQAIAKAADVTVEKIFVTHGHIDHCGKAGILAKAIGVPIEGPHQDDLFWIEQLKEQGLIFELHGADRFTPDRWLKDGDTVSFGNQTLDVVHCPGHTPGHVVFVSAPDRLAFVGDVLFSGSIGRTDFPRGNHQQLLDSIRGKLFPLGDDIEFVPGHGPSSTFGRERLTNPYVGER